jgi:hypothetical protein
LPQVAVRLPEEALRLHEKAIVLLKRCSLIAWSVVAVRLSEVATIFINWP